MAAQTKTTAKKTARTAKVDASKVANKAADAAREFVHRTTAAAEERADNVHHRVSRFNEGLERTMLRMVRGYVSVLSEIAEASHENAVHTLTTVEKLARASTLSEAAQIQANYVRDGVSMNFDRIRMAFNATRDAVTESAVTVRNTVKDVLPEMSKAA